MSKTKKIEKQHYELLYIIPNNFTEEEAGQIQEKIKEQITQKGGEFSREENWGKKKLAYPIKNFNHGYYNLVEFDSYTEDMEKISQFLKLLDEVLRFQVVKKNKETKKVELEKGEEAMVAVEKKDSKEDKKKAETAKEEEPLDEAEKSSKREEEEGTKKTEVKEQDKDTSTETEKEEAPTDSAEEANKEEVEKKAEETETKKDTASRKEKQAPEKDPEGSEKKKKEDKVDMDELDKKLDDILNTDDLL